MKRYKIVDQTLEQLMELYIEQMSQVERPVLADESRYCLAG
jgi:hypothetical protein